MPLTVCCDNSRRMDTIPSDFTDFSLYGGLYRHLDLVYVPTPALDTLWVIVTDADQPEPTVQISGGVFPFEAPGLKVTFEFVVHGPNGEVVYQSPKTPLAKDSWDSKFQLKAPQHWSPGNPQLYSCTATVAANDGTKHSLTTRFGVRYYEFVEHGPFKLNGERLLLRGTHRHEDHAGFASAMPDDLIREEMKLIKAMGANFIRLAHYQQNRLVLELCDELGPAGVGRSAVVSRRRRR